MDKRSPRDGRAIEELGTYDPQNTDAAKQVNFNTDRVKYWLDNGAQPSETVADLLARQGLYTKPAKKAKG
jgi:small subunit ribosomal protein S16